MDRRTLKKYLNTLSQELMAECLWMLHCNKSADVQDVKNVIDSIVITQSDFLARISHYEKKDSKTYFKNMREQFLVRVEEIIGQIKTLA